MTRGPSVRNGGHGPGILGRFSTSTLVLLTLICAVWGTLSAVIVLVVGLALASVVARVLVLDRAHVAAAIVTSLAVVAGVSTPAAVTRLHASLGRAGHGNHRDD